MKKDENRDRRFSIDKSFLESHFERRGELFKTITADHPHLKDCFYRIRGQAFVSDRRIITKDPVKNPILEKDEYDDHSIHCLTLFKPLDLFIGGMRIIKPSSPRGYKKSLPSADLSPALRNFVDSMGIDVCIEVSRFLLSRERVELMNHYMSEKNINHHEETIYASKLMYLIKKMHKVIDETGSLYAIASMEASLIRILKKMDLEFIPVGPAINYFGTIHPCYIDITKCAKILEERNPKIYNFLIHDE